KIDTWYRRKFDRWQFHMDMLGGCLLLQSRHVLKNLLPFYGRYKTCLEIIKKPGRCHAQYFRPYNGKGHADNCGNNYGYQAIFLRHEVANEAFDFPLKIFGFLRRPAHGSPCTTTHRPSAHRSSWTL